MDERGTPEVIRLFPTFVCKSRLASEARATVRRAILEEVGAERAALHEPEAGQVRQSRRRFGRRCRPDAGGERHGERTRA